MSSDFYDQLSALGVRFDAEVMDRTRALAERLARTEFSEPVSVETLAYGAHERHRVDIYRTKGDNKPVLLFVPGGGFVGGSRLVYGSFGEHFARMGFLVAIMDYRLAPEAVWPSGAQDVAACVTMISERANTYGGLASNITLVGHSAGATHVASAIFDPHLRSAPRAHVHRAALISGPYIFPYPGMGEGARRYVGDNAEAYAAVSPLTHATPQEPDLPVLIVAAELDPQQFVFSALALTAKLSRSADAGVPWLHMAWRHNHISPVLTLGTAYDVLSPVIERFVAATAG